MAKNTVLLLGHNVWQERSLELMLRLGGYDPRVISDSHEAVNLAKSLQGTVHSIVVPATGNQRVLNQRLALFDTHKVEAFVVLVGISNQQLEQTHPIDRWQNLTLSACMIDELLERLSH